MTRKKMPFLLVVAVFFISISQAFGHGTAANTKITNANLFNTSPDFTTATNPGNMAGIFSNASGAKTYAFVQSTSATTWVLPGYDISPLHINQTSYTQYGGAGANITFDFTLTNWGNALDSMTIRVTNRGASGTWAQSNAYEISTNSGVAQGYAVNQTFTKANIAADLAITFHVLVHIPIVQAVGDTNRFIVYLNDGAPAGDAWPTAQALLPATPDAGNVRDNQFVYCWARVWGPVIRLTKTVDNTSIRPYQTLQYTIHYTNAGNLPALGLVIRDAIPVTVQTLGGQLFISTNGAGYQGMSDGADADDAEWNAALNKVFFRPQKGVVPNGGYGNLRFSVRVK
jgi:uncharacterized repeat protein (TIGR01451 family)